MNPGPTRQLITKKGKSYDLPLFFPVYQPKSNMISITDLKHKFAINGMIVNGFFLYKDADVKAKLESGLSIHDYIGFDGLIMTDSGAFQGLKRPLYLVNKKIVAFQDAIKADIVSPLDLISPPGDNYETARKKLASTCKRIQEAKEIVKNGILAGVQQGGRFLDLRRHSMEELMKIGVEYIAIGSLVPFFNKNHNLTTIIKILKDARSIAGPGLPIHVYGAGDPVELPFLAALGADIFDSASYGHYAANGWYMTPYGSLQKEENDKLKAYACPCDICRELPQIETIFNDPGKLAGHNLFTIIKTLNNTRHALENKNLSSLLENVLQIHEQWFPGSALPKTWAEGS
ncbi:MAG: tRNA-guanine transglycosylase [Acidobacteria bacterium]|jgi:7-cyano-7-deazaguanine tRNA-ribosyltransferase|nr:tRNA-guanine transglycosylase [Acidobacteriota bacterium]